MSVASPLDYDLVSFLFFPCILHYILLWGRFGFINGELSLVFVQFLPPVVIHWLAGDTWGDWWSTLLLGLKFQWNNSNMVRASERHFPGRVRCTMKLETFSYLDSHGKCLLLAAPFSKYFIQIKGTSMPTKVMPNPEYRLLTALDGVDPLSCFLSSLLSTCFFVSSAWWQGYLI